MEENRRKREEKNWKEKGRSQRKEEESFQ